MSGQVQQVTPNFTIDTICPIVINSKDAILTYQTALSVNTPSKVNAGFSGCFPTAESIAYVFTESQINRCCGVEPTVKQVSPTYA
jgi:hypothetical protein